mgnify:CR=1 FL=1
MNSGLLYPLAVSLVLMGFGVVLWLAARRLDHRRQAERYLGATHGRSRSAIRDRGWAQALASRGAAFDRVIGDAEETRRLLIQAGLRGARARAGFYLLQISLPLGAVALGIAVLIWPGRGSMQILLIVGVLIGSLLLPRYLLRRRAAARRQQIEKDVPLFINLLILLFDAGPPAGRLLAVPDHGVSISLVSYS